MADLARALAETARQMTAELERRLASVPGARGRVIDAMRAGSLNGGKRLRPFLVMESAKLFAVPASQALNAAVALEMVHCYSLIHDDLPAMDNADLRRGLPTVHKLYDDATAILAGDGLLTEAFAVLAEEATHPDPKVRIELVAALAEGSGAAGMVGGQMIDLSPERDRLDLAGITELQALKTGALIAFGCQAGAILGRASAGQRQALADYTRNLGLAFQIADDILDVESTAEALGKPTQADAGAGKATFVKLLGLAGAKKKAADLADSAVAALKLFDARADLLRATAHFVVERKS